MDDLRFDALTRALHSRRSALAGVLGGVTALFGIVVPEEASAHNYTRRCLRLKDVPKRQACLKRARAHNRTHNCKPLTPGALCSGRCGTTINNCGKRVTCPTVCPPPKDCIVNGSCVETCAAQTCPLNCACGLASAEGPRRCIKYPAPSCEQVPLKCTSTRQCPLGYSCQFTLCPQNGPFEYRCVPICTEP